MGSGHEHDAHLFSSLSSPLRFDLDSPFYPRCIVNKAATFPNLAWTVPVAPPFPRFLREGGLPPGARHPSVLVSARSTAIRSRPSLPSPLHSEQSCSISNSLAVPFLKLLQGGCVIPNARVFTSGRRDLAWTMQITTDSRIVFPASRNRRTGCGAVFCTTQTGADGPAEIESQWTARRRERLGISPTIQLPESQNPCPPRTKREKGRAPQE